MIGVVRGSSSGIPGPTGDPAVDTGVLVAAIAAAQASVSRTLQLRPGRYVVNQAPTITGPLRLVGNDTTIALADGVIVNTDADPTHFTPVLRVQGVPWLVLDGITFDHNRDGQTYPATVNTFGRGSRPWRHNATVEITPGTDNATRSTRIVVQGCRFLNGYLSGLAAWQCSDVTVRDSYFAHNTWSGAVGCGLDGYVFDNNRGYRNGVSPIYTTARQDGDRATLQIREYNKAFTAATELIPTLPSAVSVMNAGVRVTNNRMVQDNTESIFLRACRDARISGNRVEDVGYQRLSSGTFLPAGIWFEWGNAHIDHNTVYQPTTADPAWARPDGIVCYTFTGDGKEPVTMQGLYHSIVESNTVYCGQEWPLATGIWSDPASKRNNFSRGIRVNSSVQLRGNTIEGCAGYPILIVNDDNFHDEYIKTSPFAVQVEGGRITNFLADGAIYVQRFGSATAPGGQLSVRGTQIDDGRSTTAGVNTRAIVLFDSNLDAYQFNEVDISGNIWDCTNAADPALPYVGARVRSAAASRSVRLAGNQIRGSQRPFRITSGLSVLIADNILTDCSRLFDATLLGAVGSLTVEGNTATGLSVSVGDFAFGGFTIARLVFTGNSMQGTTSAVFAGWTLGDANVTQALLTPNLIKLTGNPDLRRAVTGAPTVNAWHQGELVRRTDGPPSTYLAATTGAGAADWVPLG